MQTVFVITLNLLLTFVSCNLQPPLVDSNFGTKDEKLKAEKQQKYPPCKSCNIFVDSFKKVISKHVQVYWKAIFILSSTFRD